MTLTTDSPAAADEDRKLRRHLGFWQLTAIGFSGVIGSGWLLGASVAANTAGPASILTWLIGGVALLLVAFVLIELGASRPEAGGLVRWPFYSNGRLVATLIGWGIWVAYATNPPSEASAVLQYANHYLPGVYDTSAGRLTGLGTLAAIGIMAVLVALNWFGVALFARVNGLLTVFKFVVPALTAILLLASGFDSSHLHGPHGFAPYGMSAVLTAITTSGVIYAYTGFQGPIDLSGEAKNPRRDIPWSIVAALGLSMLVYVGLQFAFLSATPDHALIHGWSGVNFDSPWAHLAQLLGFGWLSTLLYVDAVASPAGSALVFTAETSRETFAMSKNRFFPGAIAKVHEGSGVPRRALVVNFVIGLVFLLRFGSWQQIVAATSELGLFAYSISAISEAAFRKARPDQVAGWIRGMPVLAPVSFVIATLIIYWAGWSELHIALPVLLAAVLVYVWQQWRQRIGWADARAGLWVVGYVLALLLMSKIGSFGGTGLVAQPWDSVVVGAIGLGTFAAGTYAARRHLEDNPVPEPFTSEDELAADPA
ncbi:APC family permease [Jatrophihabitans endophyticus]|uniref:APC family permease n=1 Tax=Jatrophihabitans endophyticus TaxID=1206085 RepID=UPI0019DE2CF9|nr:APC family permease [Jatrophihabitans endophyticus]MBE7190077.1 APC family permease [Jatrophihabitans endophyticus]